MKKSILFLGGIFLITLMVSGAISARSSKEVGSIPVKSDHQAGFIELAKVSLDSAVQAATQAVPGQVVKVELEEENGYLVYGVEIVKADRQTMEVKVDAGNGKVLKVEADHEEDQEGEKEE